MAWERAGFTLLLALIQTILIGLKLDGAIHSSWWAVFVPVYVWVGVIWIIVAVAGYRRSQGKENYSNGVPLLSPLRSVYFVLTSLLVLLLFILIAVRAVEDHRLPWSIVFIPLYIYLSLLLIVVLYEGGEHSKGNISRSALDSHPGITAWLKWFGLLNLFVWGVIQAIFLAIKLDGGLSDWTYWAVLAPLWVLLVLVALLCLSSLPFIFVKQLEVEWWRIGMGVLVYAAAVVALVFITLRADCSLHWKWSLVFIPLDVVLALLLLYCLQEWLAEPFEVVTDEQLYDLQELS